MKSVNTIVRHSHGLKGWAFIGYLLISISVQAKDYYVALAATGAGDGSGVADAADITTLKTFLSGYNVATDPDLNIYFSAGTYIMDNVPFTFASNENNRSGLNVVFQPLNNDAVVLSGGSSVIRLLNMGSAKNETSPLTVSIRNMAIVNFYSTGAADNGTNSLFTLGDYNVLNLEVDSIDNISSNRLPLFLMGTSTAKDSYTTVNVYQSVIKNVRGRDYGIFDSMADKITLRFINSVLSGWQAGNSPMNHYMFYLDDDNASLTMSECTVKDCGMAFLAANKSTYTELTDVHFVNNTSLFHFFYLFGNASFAGLRVENNKVTTAGYDFFHFTGDEYDINNCVFTGNEAPDNFIETGGNLFVSNSIFDHNKTTSGAADFIYFHTASHYEFTDCRFTENESKMQFFRIAAGHLALNDTHFTKNKLSYAGDNYFFHLAAGELTTTDCVFDENTVTNTSNGTVRFFYFPAGKATITGTTISGNDMRTTYSTRQYLFSAASSLILVNNTFSGNLNGVTEMSITSPVGGCINNTFYDTGDIYVYSGSYSVVNNLLLSTTNITGATTGFKRNIYKNKFYASGISGGTSITDLNTYVDAGLSEYAAGKPKIHRLLRLTEVNHPILKQGGSTITTGYANYLLFDQRKKKRPAQISIGAWDMPNFDLMNGHYTIFYDADNGGLSPYYDIDMSRYIVGYPDGVQKENVTFGAVTQPSIGTISPDSTGSGNYYFRFTPHCNANDATQPALGMMDKPTSMTWQASCSEGGLSFVGQATLTITIQNIRIPFGIIDETYVKCYTGMDSSQFKSNYKFISREVNDPSHKYDGFTSPLVGDLNGDGKPEIVTLGVQDGNVASLYGEATYIYILNGQTGKEIVRYKLPASWTIREPVHNTPSWMALVDADRDGMAEIILAYGYTASNAKYAKRVVCYEVSAETFLPVTNDFPAEHPNRLTEKWISNYRYDWSQLEPGGYNDRRHKASPLPQIADINQDGIPEILVYNKIYNALNGKLLITLENLEPNSTWGSAATTIANYKNYAYVGRNRRTTQWNDNELNFPFIYDLDGDGKMEVIAGGKVYYQLNTTNGTYLVKSADDAAFGLNIGDGYTGVADINADGKAEIVVISNINMSSFRICVWDPGFILDPAVVGDNIATHPPRILADVTVPFSINSHTGTLSYVFIGDIDGKVDAGGKRHPEISVLGPRFYYNAVIPVHPNLPANTFGGGSAFQYAAGVEGALMGWTWVEGETDIHKKLKVSFMMEHDDRSINTGFTMFDFDNDGVGDICYRSERTLRIISAKKPWIRLNETNANVIRFKTNILSYTGFEYPVVADIDGDGSADMIVMGSNFVDDSRGYIYAVQANPNETNFAPAPKVWNQYMYSPLKIREDLTTPMLNIHPLLPSLAFILNKDRNSKIKTFIYNNTITQTVKSTVFDEIYGSDTLSVLKPIITTPDVHIINARLTIDAPDVTGKLKFSVVNNGDGTLNAETPFTVFRGETENYIPSGYLGKEKIGTDVFPGDTVHLSFDLADVRYNFTIRVADSTSNSSTDLFMRHYVDCNWADNVVTVGYFVLRDDAATVVAGQTVVIDVLANDVLPASCNVVLQPEDIITAGGNAVMSGDFGTFEIIGNGKLLKYTPPAQQVHPPEIIELTYAVTCTPENLAAKTLTAKLYIYIIEDCNHQNFSTCVGLPYTFCLNKSTDNTVFEWYAPEQTFIGHDAPSVFSVHGGETYWVKPTVQDENSPYRSVNFPKAKIVLKAIARGGKCPVYRLPNCP